MKYARMYLFKPKICWNYYFCSTEGNNTSVESNKNQNNMLIDIGGGESNSAGVLLIKRMEWKHGHNNYTSECRDGNPNMPPSLAMDTTKWYSETEISA